MKDFTSHISDEDLEDVKQNRDSALNPPEIEPGMDDDDAWGSIGSLGGDEDGWGSIGDISGGSGGSDSFDGFGGSFGDSFGNQGMYGKQMQSPQQNPEDKMFDALVKGGKGSFNFVSELVKALKTFDAPKRMAMGRNTIFTSVCVLIFAIVAGLLGVDGTLNYILGSLLAMGVGVPLFMFAMDSLQHLKPSSSEEDYDFQDSEDDSEFSFGDLPEEVEEEEEKETSFFDFSEEDEEEEPFNSPFASAYDGNNFEEDGEEEIPNKDEVLESLDGNNGMITRQYLYEKVTTCLEYKDKTFDKVIDLPEDSREFLGFCKMIKDAAETVKTGNSEEMPQLISARDKLFYTQLEISRVKWMKNIQPFVEELASVCSYDEAKGKKDDKIFATGDTVGSRMFVKIMKGETTMVSIKDTYLKIKNEILDTSNYMPVVFGIDAEGEVVWRDLKSMNSLLVAGMPDSGKSWCIKTVLAQMMFYLKPSELNFIILDPKGETSDFYSMKVPHIKKFVSTDDGILKELRWVVQVEAERRRSVLKEAGGFINIWDMKKKRPDVELPLLYIVIDEVITLSDRMDKETKKEFQNLLSQLVSQMRNLGIRIFMIPHVVKDQVLKKTITDLIPCRVSVCGNESHIESTTGAAPKDFSYKLTNKGDMAVKFNNDSVEFVHGAVIADTNEGIDEFFDFLKNMWLKLEPSSASTLSDTNNIVNNKKSDIKAPKVNINASSRTEKPKLSDAEVMELLSGVNNNEEEDKNNEYVSEEVEDDSDEVDIWG